MKPLCWLMLLCACLSGCASDEPDKYGNYYDVTLTAQDMRTISGDIAAFLQQSEGASTIINLNHDDSDFAHALMLALRLEGIGVAQTHDNDYLSLNYRVEQLNPTQFFVTATLSDGRKLSRIWVLKNHQLIPLKTRAYGVAYE